MVVKKRVLTLLVYSTLFSVLSMESSTAGTYLDELKALYMYFIETLGGYTCEKLQKP